MKRPFIQNSLNTGQKKIFFFRITSEIYELSKLYIPEKKLMRTDFIAESFCRGNMLIKDIKKCLKIA
jgi:hypothetical protein